MIYGGMTNENGSMNIKISNIVKEQLHDAAIVQELPGQGVQRLSIVNRAVDSVFTEFKGVANDLSRRKRLSDAVNLAGKVSAPNDAGVQLQTIVGDEGVQRLVTQVRAGNDLTDSQANNVLAAVSPNVLNALRSELSQDNSQISSDELAIALNASEHVVSANTAHTGSTHTSAQTTQSSGGASGAASENTGLMRYALPLLLGALALLTIKYCSDSAKSRVVAEERGNLEVELADVQEESELQTTQIASLQGDYDSAQSQIDSLQSDYDSAQSQITTLQGDYDTAQSELASLQGDYDSAQSQIVQLEGDLQSSRAEAETLRDVPTDTAELQQLLASATNERDLASNSGSALQGQLNQVYAERNQALQQRESLLAELEDARTTIASNEEAIANIDRLKAEITEITAARDDALERNIELTAANEKLLMEVEAIEPTITDLESQVESLTSVRTELDQQLLETTEALDKEKSDRELHVNILMQDVESLKTQVAEAAPTIEGLEGQVASLTDEKTQLQTELADTTIALDESRSARQQDTDRLTAETTDLSGQLTQMLGFRDAAETSLAEQQTKVTEQAETITSLEEQVSSLEKANEDAGDSATALQTRLDEIDAELKSAQENLTNTEAQLTERTAALESTNDKLAVAQSQLDELEKERNGLVDGREKLTQNIADLNAEKLAAISEVEGRDTSISKLTSDLQTAVSDTETAESRITELESSLEMEQASVTELENSNAALEQENASLLADNETANGTIDSLDAQLKTQGQNLQQEQQKIETLNETVAGLEADGSVLTQERDIALSKSEVLEKLLAVTDRKTETLTRDRNALQNEIEIAASNDQAMTVVTLALREKIEQQLILEGIEDASVQSIDGDRAVSITLGSGNLFQAGQASLTREGGIVLAKLGNILSGYSDWRLDVEGHTDSQGIGRALRQRYPTNWELSSARAAAAVRHMTDVGGVSAESLSVHGFADTRPIGDNSSAEGREMNRRVDIVLRR